MSPKLISLRDSVKGAVDDFLVDEGMACPHTQSGIVALIHALAHYTEEGRALFPVVFIFDNCAQVFTMLPGSERLPIGEGQKGAETMTACLKKCAPLAQSGWCIYFERRADSFSYGLFRSGVNALSIGPSELLMENEASPVPILMLQQVGNGSIEIRGRRDSIIVHFGANRGSEGSPFQAVAAFVDVIVSDADPSLCDQMKLFYNRVFTEVCHFGHGTLAAAVRPTKRLLPRQFGDAIQIDPPLLVSSLISDLVKRGDSRSDLRVHAWESLISGMLMSDGLTIFDRAGSIRAYHVFIKHPSRRNSTAASGGARQRAFNVLDAMVGKDLEAALMLSQDGQAHFKGDRQ